MGTLSQRLLLFVLGVAVLPLVVGGFWLLQQAEAELRTRLEREHDAQALAVAESAEAHLLGPLAGLHREALQASWEASDAQASLNRVVAGTPFVLAAAMVEADPQRVVQAWVPGRLVSSSAESLVQLALPQTGVLPSQMTMGAAQLGSDALWLPVALPLGTTPSRVLVVAMSTAALQGWLQAHATGDAILALTDARGGVITSSRPGTVFLELSDAQRSVLRPGGAGAERVSVVGVPGSPSWLAVAVVPSVAVEGPVGVLRREVMVGLGGTILLLLVAALLFARGLTRRLEALTQVVDAYGRGELGSRAAVNGNDEVTALSRTFNAMGAELEAARAKMENWTDELSKRVAGAAEQLEKAHDQLLEAQKLAAIGQLGAGVAHEINNPLVGILGNVQLLLLDCAEGDPDRSVLEQIEQSAQRCREITQQLLRFSQLHGELAPLDLGVLVKRTMDIEAARLIGVQLEMKLPETAVLIDGDPGQLEQVLVQLVSNARIAMERIPSKRLRVEVRALDGGTVLIVADNGKGIPREHQSRIFEPFFTTKDVWTSTGLGLAVVYRIVQEHQGRIELQSEVGFGARFSIFFKAAGTSSPSGFRSEESIPRASPALR